MTCHTPCQPSGNATATPAAGPLVASPVKVVAMSRPEVPDPCSMMSSGAAGAAGASQQVRRTPGHVQRQPFQPASAMPH